MIYNIALIFDEKTNKQIYSFYNKIKNNLNFEFGLKEHSIPHITIIKFESQLELNQENLDDILNDLIFNIKVDFSGITFLPSHSIGCWIEILILKNQELTEIQNKLITKLSEFKIINGIKNRFRPHITLAKIKDCKIVLEDLDYSILREKQVNAKLVIGSADSNFEFYNM